MPRALRLPLLVTFLAVALAACGSDIRRTGSIDPAAKSMLVPEGGGGLLGSVKDAMRADGWRLVVQPPSRPAPERSAAAPLEPDAPPPRYRLILDYTRFDSCVTSGLYDYSLSVVDNNTGAEVLTMSGRDCALAVIRRFRAALAGSS